MKATIEFDDQLYRRLKVEAARRGRTVKDLVADGVRQVLAAPSPPMAGEAHGNAAATRQPAWFGMLERQTAAITDHSMAAVRASVARGRSVAERPASAVPTKPRKTRSR